MRLENETVWLTQARLGVFYDGQLWDARALVLKLIGSAKRSLILIDNWATAETLDLFAKKHKGEREVA